MRDIIGLVAERHGVESAVGLDPTRAPADGRELGVRLRERDLTAAPAVLNLLESRSPDAREQAQMLLAAVSPAALGRRGAGAHRRADRPAGRRQVVTALATRQALARA